MKITYNKTENLVEFAAIGTGDCFSYNDEMYIKIESTYNQFTKVRNAVNLDDGSVDFFGMADLVTPIDCELVVK